MFSLMTHSCSGLLSENTFSVLRATSSRLSSRAPILSRYQCLTALSGSNCNLPKPVLVASSVRCSDSMRTFYVTSEM